MAGKIDKLKAFFSTPDKPLESKELIAFRRGDKEGYDNVADEVARYVDDHPDEFPDLQ